MRPHHRCNGPLARLIATVCGATLGPAVVAGLLVSSPADADVMLSATAAPAAFGQAQQTAEKSSTAPNAKTSSEMTSGAACEPFHGERQESPVCSARHGGAIDHRLSLRSRA